jgi:predicted ester cyclase
VDHSLPKKTLEAQILAARRYDTFWNTGDEAMAREALAPDFFDNTLPDGRPQGVAGVLRASETFRTAVPDLRCEVRQMIVAGDRVVTHLHFTGHFTATFMRKQGHGQKIDFIATDIYRIAEGRIAEDWHLEDNLTFLQQAVLVAK